MIAKVKEGEFLGDDEMFNKNSIHFLTAVCLSKCKTVSISKAALIGHFSNFPYLRKIMQEIAENKTDARMSTYKKRCHEIFLDLPYDHEQQLAVFNSSFRQIIGDRKYQMTKMKHNRTSSNVNTKDEIFEDPDSL